MNRFRGNICVVGTNKNVPQFTTKNWLCNDAEFFVLCLIGFSSVSTVPFLVALICLTFSSTFVLIKSDFNCLETRSDHCTIVVTITLLQRCFL